ncbi:MAG: ATP:cob(I)alamin adenosyltransferase, partial [Bacteroidia bacterium]
GSTLACSPGSSTGFLPEFNPDDIQALESEIDRLTAALPELKNFILPGASQAGSFAHVARTVCRRAERLVVHLSQLEEVQPFVVTYLNRLSDYLFTLARHLDNQNGGTEIIWKPR